MAVPGFTAHRTLYQPRALYSRPGFKRSSGGVRPAIAIEIDGDPNDSAPPHLGGGSAPGPLLIFEACKRICEAQGGRGYGLCYQKCIGH